MKQKVLITGVSTGIGAALAAEFARRGDFVTGLSRDREAMAKIRKAIMKAGGECRMIPCDLQNATRVASVVRRAQALTGGFEILVNNAGVTAFKEFQDTSRAEFDAIMDTTLRGAFLVTKEILPGMIRRRTGLIVNIISYAAKTTYTASSVYSAAKAGLEAMMNSLREEARSKNIKIMNVFPGAVLTTMWSPRNRRRFGKSMMPPEHLARLVCDACKQPPTLTVEELVVRPPIGDLRV